MIGVSGSPERVIAISAALRGGLLGGLITDEATALALMRAHAGIDNASQ
jgi:DNA-binding transcriptional regulator LsrR (DeoR family)